MPQQIFVLGPDFHVESANEVIVDDRDPAPPIGLPVEIEAFFDTIAFDDLWERVRPEPAGASPVVRRRRT